MTTFGQRLQELMKQNKMTQQELANKLNVKRGSVSNWVTDRRFPDKDLLLDISRIFDVSLEYLYCADIEPVMEMATNEQVDTAYELFKKLDDENKEVILALINKLIEKR